jgi:hypothetical protein
MRFVPFSKISKTQIQTAEVTKFFMKFFAGLSFKKASKKVSNAAGSPV